MVVGSFPTAHSRAKTKRAYYMRLNLRLPEVEPEHFELPKQCPTAGCKGKRFYPRQKVKKNVVDANARNADIPFGCIPKGWECNRYPNG